MKDNKFSKRLYSFKYACSEFLAKNKIQLIVCIVFLLIGLFTGLFTAIKINRMGDTSVFESFNLTYQLSDLENFASNFFTRLLSYELVLLLLLLFSLTPFLNVFGWCLIAYRSFLVSINCVMIVFVFSFNGIIKSLLIIFPCQLIMLVIMILFFSFLTGQIKNNKQSGCKTSMLLPFLICSILLTIVNILETLLLFLFRSNVILVI